MTQHASDAPGGEPRPAYRTADGDDYDGEVFEDAKGKPFGEVDVACGRCGGSGRWGSGRGRKRHTCFGCEGDGTRLEQVRLYDGKAFDRLTRTRDRRTETKARADEARRDALVLRHADYRAAHEDVFARAEAVGNRFVRDLLAKAREWGGLTEAQRDKLYEAVGEIEAALSLHAGSAVVGERGQRLEVDVECTAHGSFMRKKFKGRRMEEVHVTRMSDVRGNAYLAITASFSLGVGDVARLSGTVKAHEERDGYPATVLNRVLVRHLVPASELNGASILSRSLPTRAPAVPADTGDWGGYEPDFEEEAPAPGM